MLPLSRRIAVSANVIFFPCTRLEIKFILSYLILSYLTSTYEKSPQTISLFIFHGALYMLFVGLIIKVNSTILVVFNYLSIKFIQGSLIWLVHEIPIFCVSCRTQTVPIKHRQLIHWSRVMHICVGNQTIIASDNGLVPGRSKPLSELMLEYC